MPRCAGQGGILSALLMGVHGEEDLWWEGEEDLYILAAAMVLCDFDIWVAISYPYWRGGRIGRAWVFVCGRSWVRNHCRVKPMIYQIETCRFLARCLASLGYDNDWLAQYKDNVTEWDGDCHGDDSLVSQRSNIIKSPCVRSSRYLS